MDRSLAPGEAALPLSAEALCLTENRRPVLGLFALQGQIGCKTPAAVVGTSATGRKTGGVSVVIGQATVVVTAAAAGDK